MFRREQLRPVTTLKNRFSSASYDRNLSFTSKCISTPWVDAVEHLLPVINIIHQKTRSHLLRDFRLLVYNLVKYKGQKKALKTLKEYRLHLHQYCLKQPLTDVTFCKTDSEGFLKVIKPWKPNRNCIDSMRYSLSVFRLIEEFMLPTSNDVTTITSESTAEPEMIKEIIDYIGSNPSILRYLPKRLEDPSYILSNKAGPNGPASLTCIVDVAALAQLEPKILKVIEERFTRYGSVILPSMYKYEQTLFLGQVPGKICLLPDKAGKTRVVAIADWWTNCALHNLHNAFMKGLSRLESDLTYHQSSIPDKVRGLNHKLYSCDMTAFTDRFPSILEKAVINAVYGPKEADEWHQIITDRFFYHKNIGKIQYKVGNPMGVLSSWAVSTFTHHVIKAFCASKENSRNYREYILLGDDSLDSNKQIYERYKSVITRLGVLISLAKCTVSELGFCEFAKRLFTSSGEITGLPVHLLKDLKSKPEQFIELLRLCRERGYDDTYLRPSFTALLSEPTYKRVHKIVASIFSLPKVVTNVPPLFVPFSGIAGLHDTFKEGCIRINDEDVKYSDINTELLQALTINAKAYIFWKTIGQLALPTFERQVRRKQKNASPCEIPDNHPLLHALHAEAAKLLDKGLKPLGENPTQEEVANFIFVNYEQDNDYYVYDQWMAGRYDFLAAIPNVNEYRFYNKEHKATRCKFDIYTLVLKQLRGNSNIPLHFRAKISDMDLWRRAASLINYRDPNEKGRKIRIY